MPHFLDSVGRSENGPRLPLGNGATFAPKVTCFTVCFSAESHHLRATAPYVAKSSRVLSILRGLGVGDPNMHGKTRHLRDPAPRILDSVGRSKS